MKKIVTVVSHPRSGSTFLVAEAGKLSNVRALMEVFHCNESVVVDHLQAFADPIKKQLAVTEDGFREKIISDPLQYLQELNKEVPEGILLFKVFPEHLPADKLGHVIHASNLIIFLLRNVLHSFISNEIAKKLERFGGVDTSEIKIEFSKSAFLWWVGFIVTYFNSAMDSVRNHNKDFVFVHYEDLMKQSSVSAWLASQLEEQLGEVFSYSDGDVWIKKQDKRISALDKVTNPAYMQEWVAMEGLSYLLDGTNPSKYDDLQRLVQAMIK